MRTACRANHARGMQINMEYTGNIDGANMQITETMAVSVVHKIFARSRRVTLRQRLNNNILTFPSSGSFYGTAQPSTFSLHHLSPIPFNFLSGCLTSLLLGLDH